MQAFAHEGARVIATDINVELLKQLDGVAGSFRLFSIYPVSEQIHSGESKSNSQFKTPYGRSLRRQHTAFLTVTLSLTFKSAFAHMGGP